MKATFSIFPKFYRSLDPDGLAELVTGVGLDTTNLVVRDGFWVSDDDLAGGVERFVRRMEAAGLTIRFATVGWMPEDVCRQPDRLRVLADNGIEEFRMGYFRVEDGDVRGSLSSARERLARMAECCRTAGVRAVYQVHHGTLVPNSWAAYALVEGLGSDAVGIMLDPGNQAHEGWENWDRAAGLLGDSLVAVGIKDVAVERDETAADHPDKGWRRRWCPIYEGITNWDEVAGALDAGGFDGTFVWMPFYDQDDPAERTRKLEREVAYMRGVLRRAGRDA